MADPRLEKAQMAMAAGRYTEAVAALKAMIQENPGDAESRNLLMECQARMMLQLQIAEKLKRAKALLAQGQAEGGNKILQEILKVDPGNREVLDLLAPPEVGADMNAAVGIGDADLDLQGGFAESPPAALDMAPDPFAGAGALDQASFFGQEAGAVDGGASLESLPEITALDALDITGTPPVAEATVLSGAGLPILGGAERQKVQEYLNEGKLLEQQGRLQEAIDVWTRIFILDEENSEVQTLIDGARSRLSANQGELEHQMTEGIAAFNSGQFDRAKGLFEKVLRTLPGHAEATYYLERIGAEASAKAEEPSGFELESDFASTSSPFSFGAPATPALPVQAEPDEFVFDAGAPEGTGFPSRPAPFASPGGGGFPPPAPSPGPDAGFGTFPAPPAPVPAPAQAPFPPAPAAVLPRKAPGKVASAPQRKTPGMAMILGGAALVLLLGVGIFIASRLLGGEEGASSPAPLPPPRSSAPAASAQPLPSQPAAGPEAGQGPRTISDQLQEARAASDRKDYVQALALFQEILKRDPLNNDAIQGIETVRQLQAKKQEEEVRNEKFMKDYAFAVTSFKEGEYKDSLTVAWRLIYPDDSLAEDLGKRTAIRRLIRDGYFNWALMDLKSGNAAEAEQNLNEALGIDPSDAEARKLRDFASGYTQKAPDASYRQVASRVAFRAFSESP